MTKFNCELVDVFATNMKYENEKIGLDHILYDILNQSSDRSRTDKLNHNCVVKNFFTWTRYEQAVVTFEMNKISTGWNFNLDIQDDGDIFISEGKDTNRTYINPGKLNVFSKRTLDTIREILYAMVLEDAEIALNHLVQCDITRPFLNRYLRETELEFVSGPKEIFDKNLKYNFYSNDKEYVISYNDKEQMEDPMFVIDGDWAVLVGKPEKDDDGNLTRYFNIFYTNRVITNRELMYEPMEFYAEMEDGNWVIGDDQSCWGISGLIENVLNEHSKRNDEYFYFNKNHEIHGYWDIENSPKIWLEQNDGKINDKINFDKSIDFDFKLDEADEMMNAMSQQNEQSEEE